ncbi:MAG: hypothetical protein VX185_09270 [Pseudomonadota bacterium]|nr:hypothetical protein [Pseudomonadota bacterium]
MNLKLLSVLGLVTVAVFGAGCEKDGPMENAGETMDNAVQDMGNSVEDTCEDVTNENC